MDNYLKMYKPTKRGLRIVLTIIGTILAIIAEIGLLVWAAQTVFRSYWWMILLAVYLAVNLLITQVIFSSEFNKHSKINWLISIWFFPLVGATIYLIFGRFPVTRYHKIKKARVDRKETLDKTNVNSKNFDFFDSHLKRKSFKNTNVELIKASTWFIRMFKELENAESYIHMEYFKFKSGEILNDLYKVLSKKVKEGVEVKIIIDDIGSINLNRNVIKKFNDAGIEMVAFNKIIALFFSGYLNFRIHRKLIVIDGKKAFLGGMNIGDEYAGLTTKYGDWLDLHMLIEGEGIETIAKSFLLDWKFITKDDLLKVKKYQIKKTAIKNNDIIKIIEDGPDIEVKSFETMFTHLISNAKKRIWIATPYTIIPKKIHHKLISAAKAGVDVRIFIPGKPDKKFLYKAGGYYTKRLSDNKVKIYKTRNLFLHSKAMLWDDEISMVGTSNLDLRSIYINYEINVFMESKKVNKDIESYFNELLEISDKVKPIYRTYSVWNLDSTIIYRLMAPFL